MSAPCRGSKARWNKRPSTKTHHSKTYQLTYDVPTGFAVTAAATKQLLAADGWVPYARPLENNKSSSAFKKGRQGLGRAGPRRASPVNPSCPIQRHHSSCERAVPAGAADIMHNEWRPYLGCIAPTGLDATLDFFRKEMAAIGWKPLEVAEAAERWPNAQLSETIENGVRAYYTHDDSNGFRRQRPVMLTLQRRDDGRTGVEIRVAPFAMPEKIEAADDVSGLPIPKTIKSRAEFRRFQFGPTAAGHGGRCRNSCNARLLSSRTRGTGLDRRDAQRRRHR